MCHLNWTLLIATVSLVTTFGCSQSDSKLGKVTGTVFVDGQPASAGLKIEFDPITKGVRGSTAVTDETGRYEAVYSLSRKGVRKGDCVVKLVLPEVAPPRPGRKAKLPFPAQYYDSIQQVSINGSTTVDLELSKEI